MAAETGSYHFRVVNGDKRCKGRGGMALLTIIRRVDVIKCFADRHGIVVATDAGPDHLGMVNVDCGYPEARVMARITTIRRINVVNTFTGCGNAIMTFNTGLSLYRGVIEYGHHPTGYCMATAAIQRSRQMIRRFASGCFIVVATHARPAHFIVINGYRRNPDVNAMAGFARVACRHMRC